MTRERAIPTEISRADRVTFTAVLAVATLLRIIAAQRYRIDSDEPQHLHVVWGWTHGLLQYRDVFDNHMPLFHLATAPFLRLFGERPESLIGMRYAMLPISAVTLWLTYRIAATCYSRIAGLWVVAVTASVPTFFLTSVEFRPDTLWAALWLAAILALIERHDVRRRAVVAGLLVGMAFATSMKTSLLAAALVVGALAAAAASTSPGRTRTLIARFAAPFAISALIAPVIIALFFASHGAFRDFLYGTMGHNLIWRWRVNRVIAYPFLLALIVIGIRELRRSSGDSGLVSRRIFVFASAHVYAATLFCLWPLVEREHWLPYVPLAAVGLVPVLNSPARRTALIATQLALVVVLGSLWKDNTSAPLHLIDDTLRLTSSSDTVVDLKGEMVFRPRAFHYVLEPITRQRISRGELRDSLPEDVIARRAVVAVGDDTAFPARGRRFLRENFISAGALRVAGCALPEEGGIFMIRIAERYAIAGGVTTGLSIDGVPYGGPRFLVAGRHTFTPRRRARGLVMIWARAVELGFEPLGVGRVRG